jgi:hypothetical protein
MDGLKRGVRSDRQLHSIRSAVGKGRVTPNSNWIADNSNQIAHIRVIGKNTSLQLGWPVELRSEVEFGFTVGSKVSLQ